jgi:hypothetical protein
VPDAPLAELIANRAWWRHSDPFAHIVARDVFTSDYYQSLERAFKGLLARGLSETPNPGRFSRTMRSYDVYSLNLSRKTEGPLQVFRSRAWHDLLSAVTGVEVTGDVNGGFHHHVVGSKSGRLHNDLNPGWFADRPAADGVNLARHDLCDYLHGTARAAGVAPRCTVRAVAMLFYLANAEWQPGDGGETGLYPEPRCGVSHATALVPPHNNSILAFECSPHSYHAFLTNRRHVRNSVILWLHRTTQSVAARWGERAIVRWPR